jgi:hypothetical protein
MIRNIHGYLLLFILLTGCKGLTPAQQTSTANNQADKNNVRREAKSEKESASEIEFMTLDDIRKLDLRGAFGRYRAEGLVWVQKQPLAVNSDYDFSVALEIEDIGPAIAARNRIDANTRTVEKIGPMPELALEREFAASSRNDATMKRQYKKIRVAIYGLLFGRESARLQTVVEFHDASNNFIFRVVYISEGRPLEGEKSWLNDNAQPLATTMRKSARILGSEYIGLLERGALLTDSPSNSTAEGGLERKCPVGNKEKVEGLVVARRGDIEIVRSPIFPGNLFLCPHSEP